MSRIDILFVLSMSSCVALAWALTIALVAAYE